LAINARVVVEVLAAELIREKLIVDGVRNHQP
jgi:hypothetical protein